MPSTRRTPLVVPPAPRVRSAGQVDAEIGAARAAAPAPARPAPPQGARNLVVVVLDSLRYDAWLEVQPSALGALGPLERRWSYASWTAPSHYNLLMGLLPHTSPPHVFASDHYREDFLRYSDRLGIAGIDFSRLLPELYLPTFLRRSLGYRTGALVSMPVLNPATAINRDFDVFELMGSHNDMAGMLDRLSFDDRPSFWLLNVGETHYPYAVPGSDPSRWPRISGVHGVVKHLGEEVEGSGFFTPAEMRELRDLQCESLGYVDGVVARLFEMLPSGTWVVVTSDHGELFGEDDFFGHGPVQHPKVYEVPFVEGLVP